MKRKFKGGMTSLSLPIIVYDNTSTTGAGLSGLDHTTSGLVLEYRRAGQSSWTSVTLVSKTLGTYVSGGIVASGSRAGRYEIDIPDAAIAAGVRMVEICLRGAANMHPVDIEIELDAVDYQDATAFGLSKFGDIETDTQNIQSRIPAALVDGRMVAQAQSVTDKTGYTLTQAFPANFEELLITEAGAIASVINVLVVDELGEGALVANGAGDAIPGYVWDALLADHTVANTFGARIVRSLNSNNTVQISGGGSNHIFAVLHDAEPNSIPEDAFQSGAVSARALAADAATEIATAVGTLQVLVDMGVMIINDGTANARFSVSALQNAPAGEGGGGQTINVYPVSASTPERVAGTTITFYRNESRTVSVVTDFTLTALTLVFVIEDSEGNDLLTIADGSISRSDKTFTVPIGTTVTATISNYRWALRDITGGTNSVIARGVFSVQEAASNA